MAPEVIARQNLTYNHKVDVWAVGVIAFQLLTNKTHPFQLFNKEIFKQ